MRLSELLDELKNILLIKRYNILFEHFFSAQLPVIRLHNLQPDNGGALRITWFLLQILIDLFKLAVIKVSIKALHRHQFIMCPLFYNISIFFMHKIKSASRIVDSRCAMMKEVRLSLDYPSVLNQNFCTSIDGTGRLVQNQNFRIGKDGTRNRQKLFLAL